MAYEKTDYDYQHNLDNGTMRISIPMNISIADCDDIEAHFALIMRQCRRRAGAQSERKDVV